VDWLQTSSSVEIRFKEPLSKVRLEIKAWISRNSPVFRKFHVYIIRVKQSNAFFKQ
jgi:hypothetical protein